MQRSLLSSAISFNTRSGRILESLSFSHLPQPPPYFSFQVKLKCWLLAEEQVVKMLFKLPTFSHLPHPRLRVSQVIYPTSSPSTAGIYKSLNPLPIPQQCNSVIPQLNYPSHSAVSQVIPSFFSLLPLSITFSTKITKHKFTRCVIEHYW